MINSIASLAADDRPREKLVSKGVKALSDSELLAIILGSGSRNQSAIQLAQLILNEVGNEYVGLGQLSIDELKKYKGVGEAKAVAIIAVMEIARRKNAGANKKNVIVNSSRSVFNHLQPYFEDLSHEEFYVIYLNRANTIIATKQISKGGISQTVVDGKIVFNYALQCKASAMILAHNHPSGRLVPSDSDKQLTQSLSRFGKFIDVQILDHLIINANNYFSFADEGLM
jgi:DNA repair protein RadC